ncbi:tape measure protein [Methylocaldum sp.]|uniref:tape measure protein n=1 Tax=Methylocaldum sp. TaxID=1969727 RepID=UPI002D50D5EB|nr:tape measure protein [Methylocaldum sp.]HYE35508.1 tape measure protein [Methylocaldum sp.]
MADYELGLKIRVDAKTGKAEIVGVGDAVKRLGEEGRQSGQKLNQGFSAARQGVQSISQQLAAARRDLIAFFLIGQGAQLFKDFVGITDAGKKMSGQLRQVTQDNADLAAVQGRLLQVADDTRSALDATVTLYARVARSTKELNTTQQQNLTFTKAINESFLLNGSTSEEAASGVIQLSQALQKGRLNGDEFVSVMEGAPLVVEALQKHLKASKEDLFKFAEEGKITSDVIVKAVLEMSGEWDRQFKLLPRTVESALTQLKNDTSAAFKDIDTSPLTRSIDEFRAILTDPQTLKAITGFAQAIVDSMGVAAKALQTFKGHGEEVVAILAAISGAKLGSRFGPTGALIGGTAGLLLSPRMAKEEAKGIKELSTEYAATIKRIGELKRASATPGAQLSGASSGLQKQLKEAEQKAAELMARIKAQTQKTDTASGEPGPLDLSNIRTLPVKPAKEKKPKASLLDDARQEIQARLELQRDAARIELEEQRAGFEAGEAALERQLDQNLIDYRTYYTQVAELRQADLDAQIEAKQREIEIAQQARANLPADQGKASIEQARLQGDIERLMSEIGLIEAQKGEIVAEAQAEIAGRDRNLADQLDQFRLKLLELQKDKINLADIVVPPEQQELFQARLAVLQNQYRDFLEQLKAAGNTEGVQIVQQVINTEAIEGFKTQTDQMTQFAQRSAENMQDAFADLLFDPFQDDLSGMAKSFSDTLRRMAAEALSQDILGALFGNQSGGAASAAGGLLGGLGDLAKGGGGIAGFFSNLLMAFGFDEGGWTGPGGRLQPAGVVHANEYVFSAPSVNRLGVGFLEALHQMTKGPSVPSFGGYANGGLVDHMAAAAAGPAQTGSVRIINTIDPNLVHDYLSSPAGEKVIVNHIQRNSGAIRQMIK